MVPEVLYQQLVRLTHKLAGSIFDRRKPQWSFSWVKLLTVMAVVLLSTLLGWSCVSPTPSVCPSPQASPAPWTPFERRDNPFRLKTLRDLGFEIATS